jgi:hypothetical protein
MEMTKEELIEHMGKLGIEPDELDDAVSDTGFRETSSINNEGLESQVTYLMDKGWTTLEILAEVEGETDEDLEIALRDDTGDEELNYHFGEED